MFQPEFEQMQRSDLETLQLKRLKATLERISSHNRLYSEKLNSLTSQDIACLEDIQQFPLMTKDDLRKGYPFKYACADSTDFMRIHMSSGTTGTPIINPFTKNDIEQWGNLMARCYVIAGIAGKTWFRLPPPLVFLMVDSGFIMVRKNWVR